MATFEISANPKHGANYLKRFKIQIRSQFLVSSLTVAQFDRLNDFKLPIMNQNNLSFKDGIFITYYDNIMIIPKARVL